MITKKPLIPQLNNPTSDKDGCEDCPSLEAIKALFVVLNYVMVTDVMSTRSTEIACQTVWRPKLASFAPLDNPIVTCYACDVNVMKIQRLLDDDVFWLVVI